MKVERGKKITMEYELGVEGGEVLESSETRGPIEYVHGRGQMLAGLEKRIEGLAKGDEQEGTIPAEEAYGTEETLPTKVLSRDSFPEGELEVGKSFQAKDQAGNDVSFKIIEVNDDKGEVTIRFNHPLAGKDISFKVKILEVTEADPEADAEADAEADPEADAEADVEANAEAEADADADPEADAEADADADEDENKDED